MGFNQVSSHRAPVYTTYEGAVAVQRPAHAEIYLLVANSLFSGDLFYESNQQQQFRLRQLLAQMQKESDGSEFILALAVYTRQILHLRTASTILLAEAFALGLAGAAEAAPLVWLRGDEHLEALQYLKTTGRKWPKQLLKAVAKHQNGLSEYQVLKYSGTGASKAISQRDALRLVHAKPKNQQQALLFKYIAQGWRALSSDEQAQLPLIAASKQGETTWERILSRRGASRQSWLAALPVMGYMALLRNLRNVIGARVGQAAIATIAARLSDPKAVLASQQMPYRFYSAYQALKLIEPPFDNHDNVKSRCKYRRKLVMVQPQITPIQAALISAGVLEAPAPQWRKVKQRQLQHWRSQKSQALATLAVPKVILKALESAMNTAASRIEQWPGRTLVLVDLSGSMGCAVSAKSTITRLQAACALGAMIAQKPGSEVWGFASTSAHIKVLARDGVLKTTQKLADQAQVLGWGTMLGAALQKALRPGFDRVLILTDEQVADQAWAVLGNHLDQQPNCRAYVINLAGYAPSFVATRQAKHPQVVSVGGFSDRVLDWVSALELNNPCQAIVAWYQAQKQSQQALATAGVR
jgi:hypothetical protein